MWLSYPFLVVLAVCAILVVGTSGDLVDRLLESDYYFSFPESKSRPATVPKPSSKIKLCLVRCRQQKPEKSCEEDEITRKPLYKSSEEVVYRPKYKPVKLPPKPSKCEPCDYQISKPKEPYVQLVKSYKPPEQICKTPKPSKKPCVITEIIYKPSSKCTERPVQPCYENVYREDQPYVT